MRHLSCDWFIICLFVKMSFHDLAGCSNYKDPVLTFCNWIPMAFAHQLRMTSLLMFPTIFVIYGKLYWRFHSKGVLKDLKICNWYDLLVIEPRLIQYRELLIVFLILHQPCALRLFDFRITRLIIPRIVIHSVQLLYLQIVITAQIPPCFNVAQRWPIWLWFWWMWWGLSVLWKSITGTSKVQYS